MLHPVSSRVQGEGKVTNCIPVDFVIQFEEDAEAGMRKDGMRRFGKNVIV